MEVVTYPRSLQWVGNLVCPHCHHNNPAWRSSGMGDCRPHFYCDRCSNVILREVDYDLVYLSPMSDAEMLKIIARGLPNCPCGGRFTPGASPKCAHCGKEIQHQSNPEQRLHDPFMMVLDGACVFSDKKPPYQVRIVD